MSDGEGGGSGGGGSDGGLADFFWGTSGPSRSPSIPHYYGDSVRQLLLGAAALMLIASPLYGNNLRAEFPFEILGALFATACAALMSPKNGLIVIGSAVLSGAGMTTYATWGIFEYDTINPIAFVLRLAVAVVFLFAFYFSMKTMRAFMSNQIGKRETIDEFDEPEERMEQERLERETSGEMRTGGR